MTHTNVLPAFYDQWHISDSLNHSPEGANSWYCGQLPQYIGLLDAGLTTAEFTIDGRHELHFYHVMSAEIAGYYWGYAYDGGYVEMSLNGGNFVQITPRGGYPYLIMQDGTGPYPENTPCYSSTFVWEHAIFDLEGFGTVQFRFRFGTNETIHLMGWFIDDLEFVKSSDPNVPTDLTASVYGNEITVNWLTPGINIPLGSNSLPGGRQTMALEHYRIYRDGVIYDSTQAPYYVDNMGNIPHIIVEYQVSGVFDGAEGPLSAPLAVEYVGSVHQIDGVIPTTTEVLGAYPNPFNPTLNVRFALAETDLVTVTVFDLLGRKVDSLINRQLDAGTHEVRWNASRFASGIYLVQIKAGSYTGMYKVLLLK